MTQSVDNNQSSSNNDDSKYCDWNIYDSKHCNLKIMAQNVVISKFINGTITI